MLIECYSDRCRSIGHDVADIDQGQVILLELNKTILISSQVQYERLPELFREGRIWRQVVLSLILNWLIGPFVRHSSKNCSAQGLRADPLDHARLGMGNPA